MTFTPDWAVPPGLTISRIMSRRGLSLEELANDIDLSERNTEGLLAGHVAIDVDLAERLSSTLGSSSSFWIKRERQYREDVERLHSSIHMATKFDSSWVRMFPVKDMRRFGWLPANTNSGNAVDALRRFFELDTSASWAARYETTAAAAAFRTSPSFASNPASVAAWLRWAEIESARIACAPWNPEALVTLLPEMRKLTRRNHPRRFVAALRELCSRAGIALVIAPAPQGCRASGATRFVSDEKALIVLSLRYKSDDHFWFTFFHEIGHLLLHGKEALFLEDGSEVGGAEEIEANTFAEMTLIPEDHQPELATLRLGTEAITRFAVRVGVSSGVVVGQLQHAGRLQRNQMNHLKRRYDWADLDELTP